MHCTLTSSKVGHEPGEPCEPVSVELYRHGVGGSLLCTELFGADVGKLVPPR